MKNFLLLHTFLFLFPVDTSLPTIYVGWENWLSSQLNAQVLVTLIGEHYGNPVELTYFENNNMSDSMSAGVLDVAFEFWESYLPVFRAELEMPVVGFSTWPFMSSFIPSV